MKKQKRNWSIPRNVATRGAWLCVGSVIALMTMMFVDPKIGMKPQYVVVLIAALFGFGLFMGNWVNATQQGVVYGHKKLLNLRSGAYPSYHFYGGTPKQYLEYFKPELGSLEKIVLVAWRHKNGNIYAVERPGRHGHVTFMLAEMDLAGSDNLMDDGFVTSHGRYVNRKEALIIASGQKQMIRNTGPVNELFSEDLWYTPKESRSPAYDQKLLKVNNFRQLLLTTLPSLEYLHDEKIQITREELEAMGEAPKAPIAHNNEDLHAALAQAIASLPAIEVLPIPDTGVLTVEQSVQLLQQAMNEFHAELDAEVAAGNIFLRDDLRHLWQHRAFVLPIQFSDQWTLERVMQEIGLLANNARAVREARLARIMHDSEDNKLYRSSEIRNAARIIAGKLPIASGEWILKGAERLIAEACDEGVVLTIELEQRNPEQPVTGNYYMVPRVREARHMYMRRLAQEAEERQRKETPDVTA